MLNLVDRGRPVVRLPDVGAAHMLLLALDNPQNHLPVQRRVVLCKYEHENRSGLINLWWREEGIRSYHDEKSQRPRKILIRMIRSFGG